jgi:hypothetical protein
VQTLGDALHHGLGRGSGPSKVLKFSEKFFMHWRHASVPAFRVGGIRDTRRSLPSP